MPIYGYACKSCNHKLDALQKMNDDVLLDCPECGEPALKRQLSAPRFRLRGQGWYETDFKKDNQRNISKSDTHSDSKDKPKKEAKSETKKESKTPAKPASSKSADNKSS